MEPFGQSDRRALYTKLVGHMAPSVDDGVGCIGASPLDLAQRHVQQGRTIICASHQEH